MSYSPPRDVARKPSRSRSPRPHNDHGHRSKEADAPRQSTTSRGQSQHVNAHIEGDRDADFARYQGAEAAARLPGGRNGSRSPSVPRTRSSSPHGMSSSDSDRFQVEKSNLRMHARKAGRSSSRDSSGGSRGQGGSGEVTSDCSSDSGSSGGGSRRRERKRGHRKRKRRRRSPARVRLKALELCASLSKDRRARRLRKLLKRKPGLDLNAVDSQGRTLLHQVCWKPYNTAR